MFCCLKFLRCRSSTLKNIFLIQNSQFHHQYNLKIIKQHILSKSAKCVSVETNLLDQSFKYAAHYSISSQSTEFVEYEKACEETLETLTEYFEDLIERNPSLNNADVCYSDGVLTLNLGSQFGTYVINRQVPNKQIWLSSPLSGPKRYDFVNENNGCWVYKHDGKTLHRLLKDELEKLTKTELDFSHCSYAKV